MGLGLFSEEAGSSLVNSSTTNDNLHSRFNLALARCGLPALQSSQSSRTYHKIGAGAWHDAYLVRLHDGTRLVIRLRKQVIYGREEVFDAGKLHEDYAPVGLYYRLANICRPGICPDVYEYTIAPDLTCTIESYMGETLSLAMLNRAEGVECGRRMGQLFQTLHQATPPMPGLGELVWQAEALRAEDQRPLNTIWQVEVTTLYEQLDRLASADFHFERAVLRAKLEKAIQQCRFDCESVTLVNRDTTPENLIVRNGQFAGLIDPVPSLHNGHRYAALFVYVYSFLLPALSDAPRYAQHQFKKHSPIMAAMADGFRDGYCQGDAELHRRLDWEVWRWAFTSAAEYYGWLCGNFTTEMRLRTGGEAALASLVQNSLTLLTEN